ncbi:MAG TPA: hypothetical protein VF723_12120 [Pyrinomonadaceae bacterium]|jgi:hypothetical protein
MEKSKRSHIIDDIHMTPDTSYISNPDVQHEESDVNIRSIVIFAVGLFVFAAIVHVLMWLMYDFMEDRATKADPTPAPMAFTDKERLPPEPRLQLAPGFGVDTGDGKRVDLSVVERWNPPQAEMHVLQELWDRELQGGADPRTGVPYIPIEEAKRMLLEQGLPARQPQQGGNQQQGPPVDVRGGMDIPSYQSSGRQTEKRDQ